MDNSPVRLDREEINRIFKSFEGRKVLVIGDVMLDAYWWGNVDRISPEAPVPVVHIRKKEYRLGGAANVAINLRSLGATPVICAVAGDDTEGEIFKQLIDDQHIRGEGLVISAHRPTTVKTRVISGKNQMLRIDHEEDFELNAEEKGMLLQKLEKLVPEAELIIFEDYDKGVLSPAIIEKVVAQANALHIPIAVDPKKRNFLQYRNVTLFKPNLRELAEGLKTDLTNRSKMEDIQAAAGKLKDDIKARYAMITLSERGVLIAGPDGQCHVIPAHVRDIYDVSGAGDTVISVAALTLAAKASPEVVAALANLAGGLVCEKVGVVPIERDALLEEALKVMAS